MCIIGRLELISSKYEEFERFYQMKGFPKEISTSCTASFTFVTSSKSDLLSSICKCRSKKEFVFELG